MTPSFYGTPENQIRLLHEADKWVGTPFRENSAVKGAGGGVSCHNLVAEIYFQTGFLARFIVPTGSARRLRNGPSGAMLEYINQNLAGSFSVIVPQIEEAITGDLIFMRDASEVCHLGIALPQGWFIHVLPSSGVMLSLINDPTFKNRVMYIRRPNP